MFIFLRPYARYFGFRGRSDRLELWSFLVFLIIASVACSVLDYALFGFSVGMSASDGQLTTGPIAKTFALVSLIPELALSVRRLHDANRSGWWIAPGAVLEVAMLLASIAVGVPSHDEAIALLVLVTAAVVVLIGTSMFVLFAPGTKGANRFGASPREARLAKRSGSASAPAMSAARLDQLERLGALRSQGLLNEAEYEAEKQSLLSSHSATTSR